MTTYISASKKNSCFNLYFISAQKFPYLSQRDSIRGHTSRANIRSYGACFEVGRISTIKRRHPIPRFHMSNQGGGSIIAERYDSTGNIGYLSVMKHSLLNMKSEK